MVSHGLAPMHFEDQLPNRGLKVEEAWKVFRVKLAVINSKQQKMCTPGLIARSGIAVSENVATQMCAEKENTA